MACGQRFDADPAVLAQYNPLGGALVDSFYPARFNQYVDHIQDLIDGGERRYRLSPEDGALPACNSAELASMAPILPDYRKILNAAQAVSSVDDLLTLAEMQLRWREGWAQDNVSRYASGKLSLTPRDGLAALPACREAAELLWLMHLTVSDASSSTALAYAGVYDYNNPYLQVFNQNADKVDVMIARIESSVAEPGAVLRKWTTCTDTQRAALKDRLPEYRGFVLEQAPLETLDDYLTYIEDDISWRDDLWASLPDCADAIELALAFSKFAGDQRAVFAYWLAEVPTESNPFVDAIDVGEFIVEGFGYGLVGGSAVRPRPPRLFSCSETEFESMTIIVAQYDILREAMTDLENLGEFLKVAGFRFSLGAKVCPELYQAAKRHLKLAF